MKNRTLNWNAGVGERRKPAAGIISLTLAASVLAAGSVASLRRRRGRNQSRIRRDWSGLARRHRDLGRGERSIFEDSCCRRGIATIHISPRVIWGIPVRVRNEAVCK